MSLLSNIFRKNNEKQISYEKTLNEKRAKLTAPVTEYNRNNSKKKYFVNYRGERDFSKNPRLSKPYLPTGYISKQQ